MGSGFDLYRSEDGSSYKKIAFINFTGGANYIFDDIKLNTREMSYYYKALAKDSCGNDRTQSTIVKSVWLQVADVKQSMFEREIVIKSDDLQRIRSLCGTAPPNRVEE